MVRGNTEDFGSTKHWWDYVVLDEGHTIKNAATGTAQACHQICKPNKTHRLLLTGTPIMNRLNELWTVFDWATAGKVLGEMKEFKRQYARVIEAARDAKASPFTIRAGERACQELRALLVPRHFLQRMKADYLADKLPTKTELVLWTHLSDRQRDLYDRFLREDQLVRDVLRGRTKRSPLEALTALKKLCSHPLLYTLTAEEELGETLKLSDSAALLEDSEKLRLLRDLIGKLDTEGHKTLIFSQSTRMLDIIEKILTVSTTRIDGQVTGGERQARVDEFNAKDSVFSAMLCSTKAAGVGYVVCLFVSIVLCLVDAGVGLFS